MLFHFTLSALERVSTMLKLVLLLLLCAPLILAQKNVQLLNDCTLNTTLQNLPVIVNFFGKHCKQCNFFDVIFGRFNRRLNESKDYFNFVTLTTGRVDCTVTRGLCKKLGIRTVPKVRLYPNTNYIVEKRGIKYDELVQWVAKWLKYTPCWIKFMLADSGQIIVGGCS